jgi:hypothetical protein
LAGFNSIDGLGSEILVGGRFEKAMAGSGNAVPVFGLCADVLLGSPDADNLDSYTDILFGGFLGGRVEVVENFSIAGHMGLKVGMVGERFENDESSTNFGTFANIAIRYTGLWGN